MARSLATPRRPDVRGDLKAASIPYVVEVGGEKRYLDFHALRASFISALAEAGIGPKELQELARHSDPRLTLGVYTHVSPKQLAGAVGRLPLHWGEAVPFPIRSPHPRTVRSSPNRRPQPFGSVLEPRNESNPVASSCSHDGTDGDVLRLAETNAAGGDVPVGCV